jgi:hypothetical protein
MGDGEFQKHTSCISEAQKYEKTVWKGDKAGPNKKVKTGQQQQQQAKTQQQQGVCSLRHVILKPANTEFLLAPALSVPSTSTNAAGSHGTAVVNGKAANTDAPVPAVPEAVMSEEGKNVASKQKEKKDKKRKRKDDTATDTIEEKATAAETAPAPERKQENWDVSMAGNGDESAKADADTPEKKKKRQKNRVTKEEASAGVYASSSNGPTLTTTLQKALDDALSSGSSINLKAVVEKANLSSQNVLDLLVVRKGKKSGYTLELAAVSQ